MEARSRGAMGCGRSLMSTMAPSGPSGVRTTGAFACFSAFYSSIGRYYAQQLLLQFNFEPSKLSAQAHQNMLMSKSHALRIQTP
jgi:hypothetical protein